MERVLRKILNNSLGDFFENISANDVKVGIFSGKVQLRNLRLKPTVMERAGLPVKLISGLIGHVLVDVSWTQLGSSPIVIEISEVYLLLAESQWQTAEKYFGELILDQQKILKQIAIQQFEVLNEQKSQEKSFIQRFVKKLIDNIQLKIKSLHIQIKVRNESGGDFSMGILLKEIVADTCNSNWQKEYQVDKQFIHKLLTITDFELYLNQNTQDDNQSNFFEDTVYQLSSQFPRFTHMFYLASLEVKLILNDEPQPNQLSIDCRVQVQALNFQIRLSQINNIRHLLRVLQEYAIFQTYIVNNIDYALSSEVDWNEYRKLYRNWIKSKEQKNKKNKINAEKELETAEEFLKTEDILFQRSLIRQRMKIESLHGQLSKDLKTSTKKLKKQEDIGKLKKALGMNRSSVQFESSDELTKLEELKQSIKELEDKEQNLDQSFSFKLEDFYTGSAQKDLQADQAVMQVSLSINMISISLFKDRTPLLGLGVENFNVNAQTRPNSISLTVDFAKSYIQDFIVKQRLFPNLWEIMDVQLLVDTFQTKRIVLRSGRTSIVVNVKSIAKLLYIFQQQLKTNIMNYAEDAKRAASYFVKKGQQYMIEKEEDLDFPEIDLSLRAPEIYFPLNIKNNQKDIFVVDLGNLSIRIQQLVENQMSKLMLQLKLQNLQFAYILKSQGFKQWQNGQFSQILEPLSMNLDIKHCNTPDNIVPKIDVKYNLFQVRFKISINEIQQAQQLMNNVKGQIQQAFIKQRLETRARSTEDTLYYTKHTIIEKQTVKELAVKFEIESFDFILVHWGQEAFHTRLTAVKNMTGMNSLGNLKVVTTFDEFEFLDKSLRTSFQSIVRISNCKDSACTSSSRLILIFSKSDNKIFLGYDCKKIQLMLNTDTASKLQKIMNQFKDDMYTQQRQRSRNVKPGVDMGDVAPRIIRTSRIVFKGTISKINILLIEAPKQVVTNSLKLTFSPLVHYRSTKHVKGFYQLSGDFVEQEKASGQDEATIMIRNLQFSIKQFGFNRLMSKFHTIMYPYRMSIDFHREMNDIEVGMDFESFGMFIGYNDVMIIQQLLETVQKSIEADIEKEEEFRSLQQTEIKESSKLDLNIKFSMFKISLIDERASNKHALLRLNINSTQMNVSIIDQFNAKISCIVSGEFYNAGGAMWQPFLEQTKIIQTIQKTTTGCLEFDVLIESELNINISYQLISSLSLFYRTTQVQKLNLKQLPNESIEDYSRDIVFKFRNELGLPLKVYRNQSNQEIAELQSGESIEMQQNDLVNKGHGSSNSLAILEQLKLNEVPTIVDLDIEGFGLIQHVNCDVIWWQSFKLKRAKENINIIIYSQGVQNQKVITIASNMKVYNDLYDQVTILDPEVKVMEPQSFINIPFQSNSCCQCKIRTFKGDILCEESCIIEYEEGKFASLIVLNMKNWYKCVVKLIIITYMISFQNLLPYQMELHIGNKTSECLSPGEKIQSTDMSSIKSEELQFVMLAAQQYQTCQKTIQNIKELWRLNSHTNLTNFFTLVELDMTFIDSILINLPGFDILDYISNDEILTSIFPKRVKFFADLIIINKSGYSLNIMNGKYQIMLPQSAAGFLPRLDKGDGIQISTDQHFIWSEPIKHLFSGLNRTLTLPQNNKKLHFGYSIKQLKDPFSHTLTVTIVPRLIIRNQLKQPLYYKQFRFDAILPIYCLQPGEFKVFENHMLDSKDPYIAISLNGVNFSYPILLEKISEFQITVPMASPQDQKALILPFQGEGGDQTNAKILHLIIGKGSKGIIEMKVLDPPYFEYIVQNFTGERMKINQIGGISYSINNDLTAYFAYENPLAEVKMVRFKIDGSTKTCKIDRMSHKFQIGKIEINLVKQGLTQLIKVNYARRKGGRSLIQTSFGPTIIQQAQNSIIKQQKEQMKKQNSQSILFNLQGFKISFTDCEPKELFLFTVSKSQLILQRSTRLNKLNQEVVSINFNFYVSHFQVDNMNVNEISYPVIIYPTNVKAKHQTPILQVGFNFKYTLYDQGNGKMIHIDKVFDNISIVLPELTFKFDIDTMLLLSNLFTSISKKFSFNSDPHKQQIDKIFKQIPQLSGEQQDVQDQSYIARKKYYVQSLSISKTKLNFNFRNLISDQNQGGVNRQLVALANLLDSVGGSLLNISDLEIQFPDFREGPLIATMGQLAYQISNTYTNKVLLQMHKVIGCSNLLGNPFNLWNNYRQSLQDVFVHPVLELGNEPLQVFREFLLMFKSVTGNIVGGTFDSINKLTRNGYSLITAIYDQQDISAFKRSSNPAEGFYHGAIGFGKEIYKGISGIVTKPIKEVKYKGWKSLHKGVLKGILGAIFCPITSSLRLTSHFANGIATSTQQLYKGNKATPQIRLPRAFGARGAYIQYNQEMSKAQQFLKTHPKYNQEKLVYVIGIQDYNDLTAMITSSYFVLLLNLNDIACIRLDTINACELHFIEETKFYYLAMQYGRKQLVVQSRMYHILYKLFILLKMICPHVEEIEEIEYLTIPNY